MLEDHKKSEFNESIEKIQRLSDYQKEANYYSCNSMFHDWYMILNVIYREIYSKLPGEIRKEVEENLSNVAQQIGNDNLQRNNYTVGAIVNPGEHLFKLDCRLRELIDQTGYGTPDKKDSKKVII